MKKRLIVTTLLMLATVAAFCQVTNDQAADVLANWGVSKPLALTILAIAGVLIGKLVPNKYADIFHYVRILFDWLDEHTNRLSTKQKLAKAQSHGKAFKMIIFAVLLSGIGISASAQSLFKPVTQITIDNANHFKLKGTDSILINNNSAMFLRLNAGIVGEEYFLSPETNKMESQSFKSLFFGVSYANYIKYGDGVFNNWSINGGLLVPTEPTGKFALGITGTIMKYLTGGVDYRLNTKRGFKYNLGYLLNLSYTF